MSPGEGLMGWTNFILIKKLNLAVETSRSVEELTDYELKALRYLSDEENIPDEVDIGTTKVQNITVKDLATLFTTFDHVISLTELDSDKFLLYWLKTRGISYEIKSEYNINRENLKKDGYLLLERNV